MQDDAEADQRRYPGARWWKFDFHTHTPASSDSAWTRNGAELQPAAWLRRFMEAEIDCVAITDHNTGAWVDPLKAAYTAMERTRPTGFRELHIFPGVELSVTGGFHLLAIFDTSASSSDIDALLGAVAYRGTRGDSDGVTQRSAFDVIEHVIKAGAVPIPAHADREKGLLELREADRSVARVDAQTLRQILDCPLLAVELVDREAAKPQVYLEAGRGWTEVVGSDCHSFRNDGAPGGRYTWVKMVEPSLEGLRLALLDGARFSVRRYDEPNAFDPLARPKHFVEKLEISDARYSGRGEPMQLAFSPWFNALVGGRGTGKSTIVHALRIAYRREAELERLGEENETKRVFEAFCKVPKSRVDTGGLLEGTQILVTLERDGTLHRIRWRRDGGGDVVEERSQDEWVTSQSQVVTTERFPIRIFSQGQIAALAGERQEALLGLIDDAANTLMARQALEAGEKRFFALRAKTRELDGQLKTRERVLLQLEDVQRKLRSFDEAEHALVLREFEKRSRQLYELDKQLDTGRELARRLAALVDGWALEDLPKDLFGTVDAADRQAVELVDQLHTTLATAVDEVRSVQAGLETTIHTVEQTLRGSGWGDALDASQEGYERLTTELKKQGVADPEEYGRLVEERQQLEHERDLLEIVQEERDETAAEADEQRKKVRQLRRQLTGVRKQFLADVLAQNDYVRIELLGYGRDAHAVERSIRETLGVRDDRFKDDILEVDDNEPNRGLVADLLVDLPDDQDAAVSAIEQRLDACGARFDRACSGTSEFRANFRKYVRREYEKHPEFLDRLLVFSPEDGLRVAYSPKGDGTEFSPIGHASAGQRAAAMLAFLLAHGSEPLVLDQPEDDLDNHLIYDLVVRQIRENKMRRQLIVVTHNPNIVVNGDAEMIFALDFRGGQCRKAVEGSLQERPMREEVCRVMEGGREAFERRYRRLGRDS